LPGVANPGQTESGSGKAQYNTGGSQHRYERGPPRFHGLIGFAHGDVAKYAGGV